MPLVPAETAASDARQRLSGSTDNPCPPMPDSAAACRDVRGSISVESAARMGVPGRVSRGRSLSQAR